MMPPASNARLRLWGSNGRIFLAQSLEVSSVAEVRWILDPTALGKLTRLINKLEPSIVSNVTDFLGIEITAIRN